MMGRVSSTEISCGRSIPGHRKITLHYRIVRSNAYVNDAVQNAENPHPVLLSASSKKVPWMSSFSTL